MLIMKKKKQNKTKQKQKQKQKQKNKIQKTDYPRFKPEAFGILDQSVSADSKPTSKRYYVWPATDENQITI